MADSDFNTSNMSAFVKTTYDKLAHFALRPELFFDQFATESPTLLAMRGNVVTETFYADLAAATTELNELTDPDTVSASTSTITATLREYGNVARSTAKYRGVSFEEQPGPDPSIANLIGYNAGLSQDTLARDVAVAGSNVVYGGTKTARNTLTPTTDAATVQKIAYVVAKLRGNNVRPWAGSAYVGVMHPDVTYDLMTTTGDAGWLTVANYSASERRFNGEIGMIAGAKIVESPRAPIFVDASSGSGATGTVDVYASLFFGKEALFKTYSKPVSAPTAQIVMGPQVDRLRRHHTIGWYWLGAYARFREAAIYRLESPPTIGTNA